MPRSLSLKAAAAALDAGRAVMADAKAVTRSTGYVLGGVSPIGQRTTLPTVVDEVGSAMATRVVQRRAPGTRGGGGPRGSDRDHLGGDRRHLRRRELTVTAENPGALR